MTATFLSSTMKQIVCVGACYIDTILTVPHYPAEDAKLRATALSRRRGGNCPNTLEVLQQLVDIEHEKEPDAYSLVLLAVLPNQTSPATELISKSLPGVELKHCIYRDGCSEAASSYIIRNEATDTRTIVNYNELPEMTLEEFARVVEELKDEAEWWHFEGRIPDVTLECIRYLRRWYPNAKVSVEVEKPGREGLKELAAEADVVFFSKGWAEANNYTDPKEFLVEEGAKICTKASLLFCTWGEGGAVALEPRTGTTSVCPAFETPDIQVVDAVGAGDTFTAGMLFTCALRIGDLDSDLAFAVKLAGMKVKQEGFSSLGGVMVDDINALAKPEHAHSAE